ncbi:MAG: phage tail tape measure protein, partial [Proteobacteria bacterium]
MTSPRALIEMVVDGAAESRRRVESVADAVRRMNDLSLQNISNQMSSLNDRYAGLQSTIGNVTSFAIAGVSLATLGSKVVGVLDSMGELDDLSQKIGTSVESLSRIQRVAKTFGVDFAGTVDPAMVKLARNLTTVDDKSSRTSKALAAIGVSAKDSAGKLRDPGQVMIDVAKSLAQYEDGAGKAAVVTDLFGKSGADLLPFLNDLADNVDKFTGVTPEAVKQATDLQDKFGMLSQRTDQAFTSIVTAALPALTGLSEGFTDVLEAENGLIDNGEIAEWAGMAAMGIARVADVAVLAVRGFSALASSVEVITADLEVLWTASPANMGLT